MSHVINTQRFWKNAVCIVRNKLIKNDIQRLSSTAAFNKKINEQSTVDPSEVKKFSEMAGWWDENGPVKALHAFNLVRIPFVRDGLVPQSVDQQRTLLPLKGKTILDVGCGGGIMSEGLAKIGAEVTGVDANKDLIELAKAHSSANDKLPIKPNYYLTTIEEHSEEFANYYDGVVASEVIEHIENKELFVKACVKTLKPGGRIFFTTPTRSRLCQVIGIWAAEYVFNLVPKGTHEYHLLTTPTELTFLLERNNCHVELIYGVIYNPLINRFSFINSQKLMFALQAVKC